MTPPLLSLLLLLGLPPAADGVGEDEGVGQTVISGDHEGEHDHDDEGGEQGEGGDESDDEPQGEEEVTVRARRAREASRSRQVSGLGLTLAEGDSTDRLLQQMPGLHQSAHGGQGKAYQYFLRGFDAVHGAEIAIDLAGIPLNETSQIHGNGYLDLHFIPRSLVQSADLLPGPAGAEVGNFGVAGSGSLSLGLPEEGLHLTLGGGTDRSFGLTLGWRPEGADEGDFVVADVDLGDGAGPARAFRQFRLALGAEQWFGGLRLKAFLLGYRGDFDSPGVVLEEEVELGKQTLLGSYPGAGGGRSQRVMGGLSLQGAGQQVGGRLLVYAGWRGIALEQNFTGWYRDPVHGDGRLQTQQGVQLGLRGRGWWAPGARVLVQAGLDLRGDLFTQEEHTIDVEGERLAPVLSARVGQWNPGVWASAVFTPTDWLELEPGLRFDALAYRLSRSVEEGEETGQGAFSAWAPVLSPRFGLVLRPAEQTEIFARYARGFRSPEARGLTPGRAPVSASDAVEVGLSTHPIEQIGIHAAVFATFLGNELVFDHTAARFLASGATRRLGLDVGLELLPLRWLFIEAGLSFTDGRYTDDGLIPYAPRLLTTLSVWLVRLRLSQRLRLGARLGGRLLGPRPLPSGFVAPVSGTLDLGATLEAPQWSLDLKIDNLLGLPQVDGVFWYPSRWDPNGPRSELPRAHLTAGLPFTAKLSFTVRLPDFDGGRR